MSTIAANNHTLTMPTVLFTTNGIENLLSNLDPNKAQGPDRISPYILKYCAAEISPILQVIFTQSLKHREITIGLAKGKYLFCFQKR